MQDFKNTMLRDARLIVGSPENYVDDPTQFATAWARHEGRSRSGL
ncbi:hypothetical protein [Pseudophaeobacter leonis]|nr:hypothetical protein [Pseudophaeobacter leonis]